MEMESDMESGVWRGITYLLARVTNVPKKTGDVLIVFWYLSILFGGEGGGCRLF